LQGSIASSDSDTAEALADSLEAQIHPITVSSVAIVTDIINVGPISYFLTPAGNPKPTSPDEVHEAIRRLKVAGAPSPNCIPSRALNLVPH
jgi:hypothetical protein